MEITTTKEVAEKPNKRAYRKGVYSKPLEAFMDSDQGTLKFSFTNSKDAGLCMCALRQYITNHNLNAVTWRKDNCVYVIKG